MADFTANTTTGHQPLAVQFTDTSANSPTGWAWYFGDEQYDGAWQEVNANSSWSPRDRLTSVVLPDGSIVLMGGNDGANKNNTWRSTNNGSTWSLVNASSGWSGRNQHTSVVLSDGSIVLMGGFDENYKNDVWRSEDHGATWSLVNANADWSARWEHTSVVLSDGSIVLMGGYNGTLKNDTWRSTNNGATWSLVNASSGWSARREHTSVVLSDGSIVLMGGYDGTYKKDTWRSTNNGATWSLVNASSGWSARYGHTSVVLPDDSIVLMGGFDGNYKNDIWRSTDGGEFWIQINASADWSGRNTHTGVVLPDGSIMLMGGRISGGTKKNDVWRLETAGSTIQNPVHTYPDIGTFRVALQAFNNGGFNNKIVADYITVTAVPTPTPDPTPSPTPRPSGGGGGRSVVPTISGIGAVSFLQGSTGQVLQNYKVSSSEGTAQVYLLIGTTALGPDGRAVGSITVEDVDPDDIPGIHGAPGDPSGGFFMIAGTGHAVLCSPAGATFSPSVPLTFTFSPEEWEAMLADANGIREAFAILWYDPQTGLWEEVQTTVDPNTRTVTATISHFSIYAVFVDLTIALPVATATEAPVYTPVATPLAESTQTLPLPEPAAPFSGTLTFIAVLIAIILICGICGAYYYSRKV